MHGRIPRAFTLVEVLVVIGIIGLLAGLLFAVLPGVREKARQARCLSNQRQLAQEILMALQDNKERFPPVPGTDGDFWARLKVDPRMLRCPSQPELKTGYLYNARIAGLPLANLPASTRTPLTVDSTSLEGIGDPLADYDPRHHGKVIVSFADGHVALRQPPTPLIVFASDREGDKEVYRMDGDGQHQARLTYNSSGDTWAVFSPDRQTVVFTSQQDGNAEIYRMDIDGAHQRNLTNNPATDCKPLFSPDGETIYFQSLRDDNLEIYAMDADGGHVRSLTKHPGWNSIEEEESVSPDGKKIAFLSNRDGGQDLYVMDVDGSNQKRLTFDSDYAGFPAFSPDSRTIVCTLRKERQFGLYLISLDNSRQRLLTEEGGYQKSPVFSPDGSRIAFISHAESSIYVIGVEGDNLTKLTYQYNNILLPIHYCPDGRKILYFASPTERWKPDIFVTNTDGSGEVQLTSQGENTDPVWAPMEY